MRSRWSFMMDMGDGRGHGRRQRCFVVTSLTSCSVNSIACLFTNAAAHSHAAGMANTKASLTGAERPARHIEHTGLLRSRTTKG